MLTLGWRSIHTSISSHALNIFSMYSLWHRLILSSKLAFHSIPAKVFEYLNHCHDCSVNTSFSPSKQCWFIQVLHTADKSIFFQITLYEVNLTPTIVVKGVCILPYGPNLLFSYTLLWLISVPRSFGRRLSLNMLQKEESLK